MRLVFFGPPGAGKGTVAGRFASEKGIPHISTGDLFREAIKNETELGRQVKQITESGALVPDSLTIALVAERLGKKDAAAGFVLDGFPRTIPQADALAKLSAVDRVVNFVIVDAEVIERLTGRRVCRSCGANYHVENVPPRKEGICDRCGGEIYVRNDDRIEAVRIRLEVYKAQTEPLIGYYRDRGVLVDVDAAPPPDVVYRSVESAVSSSR